jgi:hypothetical protein
VYPLRVGELLVQRRRRASELTQVRVYRGRPNPARQQGAARANDRQASEWERSQRVAVIRRQGPTSGRRDVVEPRGLSCRGGSLVGVSPPEVRRTAASVVSLPHRIRLPSCSRLVRLLAT